PKPYKRDSSGVAPASPQVAYRALLERCIGRPPKKVGAFSVLGGPDVDWPRYTWHDRSRQPTCVLMEALGVVRLSIRPSSTSSQGAGGLFVDPTVFVASEVTRVIHLTRDLPVWREGADQILVVDASGGRRVP